VRAACALPPRVDVDAHVFGGVDARVLGDAIADRCAAEVNVATGDARNDGAVPDARVAVGEPDDVARARVRSRVSLPVHARQRRRAMSQQARTRARLRSVPPSAAGTAGHDPAGWRGMSGPAAAGIDAHRPRPHAPRGDAARTRYGLRAGMNRGGRSASALPHSRTGSAESS